MVSLSDKALAIVLGIETIAGKGPTGRAGRAALKAGARAIIAGTTVIGGRAVTTAPSALAVGRAGLSGLAGFARRRPALAAAGTAYGLERIGALDPIETAIEDEVSRRMEEFQRAGANPIYGTLEDVIKVGVPKEAKRKLSKFNRAVKAGMSAVKKSKFMGKPGTIKNPKQAFTRVNKVASTINQGRKAGTSGIVGVIKRGIGKIL